MSARTAMLCLHALATALLGTGCSFGSRAIERTHGKYSAAVQLVEEEEFLKNIVRLRYVEEPRNLQVSSIATQYELSAGAEARPFFNTEASSGGNTAISAAFSRILPFASVGGANRPTVSMDPMDDGARVRQFLTPITGETVAFLTQSGWPVSSVMRIWMDRLNGVPNWVPSSGPFRDKLPDYVRFHRANELLQIAQDREYATLHSEDRVTELSGPLPVESIDAAAAVEAAKSGFEYRPRPDGKAWSLVKRDRRMVLQMTATGRTSPELKELASILNLKPGEDRYEVTVASGVADPAANPSAPLAVLRLTPRSTAQAMFFLANGVEVPPEHVASGLVRMPPDGTDPVEATRGVFAIHSCGGHRHKPPPCAYVAVWYRDH